MQRQRDSAYGRAARLKEEAAALQGRIESVIAQADQERRELTEHARSVEDRALQEIDRARQALKSAQAKHATAEDGYSRMQRELRLQLDAALNASTSAQHRCVAQTRVQMLWKYSSESSGT